MLSIFSCVCWPSVSLLWRNVCLGLWPIFLIGLLVFFDIKLYELFVYSRNKSLVYHIICKYFLPVHRLSFCSLDSFLCCAKAFKFNSVPFVYFCFYLHYSRRHIQKNIAVIYVKECLFCLCFPLGVL